MWVPLPPPYAGPEVASQQLAEACGAHLDLRIENATLRTQNMAKGRFDTAGVIAFSRAYRRFVSATRDVDIVYLVIAANRVAALRDAVLIATARALGKTIVLHLRGGAYDDYYRSEQRWMQRVLRQSWGSAACAIVQTARLAGQLADAAPEVAIAIVPNGLRGERHPPKRTYASPGLTLLFVGHLSRAKGFLDLVSAFRVVRAHHPNARLVCAGELEATALVRAALATPGVVYVGIVSGSQKLELFQSADIFALPSYAEGFSLAILEAMFHGLPVVATSVGGAPDVIGPESGYLVPPGDVGSLSEALCALAADAERREQMGRANAIIARSKYELEDVARQFAHVFTALETR